MNGGSRVRSAAIYARTDSSVRAHIEFQEQACRELAASRGWPVGEVYADLCCSAFSKERPQYLRMVEDVRWGRRDALIVHNAYVLSRLDVDCGAFQSVCRVAGRTVLFDVVMRPQDLGPSVFGIL